MTIAEWLQEAPFTNSEIAEKCGVDRSQPTAWRNGRVPHGRALLRLVALSGNKITADDLPDTKPGDRRKKKRVRSMKRRAS